MSSAEQEVLSKTSVFRGGCTREAAEAVTDATLPLLASLVDKALVRRARSGRYEMHELLRQFAMAQLKLAPDAHEQIQDKHCTYFAAFVEQRILAFKTGQQKESLVAFTTDIDNIRSAWNSAIACENWQAVAQMAECFWILGEYQGALREREVALQQAVTVLRTISAQTEETILKTEQEQLSGFLLAEQGYLCGRQSKYDQGIVLAEQGLALLRQTKNPDPWKEAMILMYLSFTMLFQGRITESRQVAQEGLALFSKLSRSKFQVLRENSG
ncbi:hypothetical protein KFU94_69405 [Chloroflexi bacterium TSY]|nr:hypothetical protein [Chloroflexi bacterium TSY]